MEININFNHSINIEFESESGNSTMVGVPLKLQYQFKTMSSENTLSFFAGSGNCVNIANIVLIGIFFSLFFVRIFVA